MFIQKFRYFTELSNVESTNSEVLLEEEPKGQLTQGISTSHISTDGYSSYINSDRIIGSHHSGIPFEIILFLRIGFLSFHV